MAEKQVSFFIDEDLFKEFGIKAIKEGKKKKEVMIQLIKNWVKK